MTLQWLPTEPGTYTHEEAMEILRPIPKCDGYYADCLGSVWSTHQRLWRKLSQSKNGHGYFKVSLFNTGRLKTFPVHKLIALAFHGEPSIKTNSRIEVRHLDGNKENNRIDNLSWGTAKENSNDRNSHGTSPKGEKNHFSKLKTEDILFIRESLKKGNTQKSIAKKFNVNKSTISYIHRNVTWNHVRCVKREKAK